MIKYLSGNINIAAHRGSCGGNIPPNTIPSFEAALFQGASIIEMDIARSKDGVLYMFHTGTEKFYLGVDHSFESLSSHELDQLYLNNEFGKSTHYKLDRFETVLRRFKNRCIMNLDRAWDYWEEIVYWVERHDMREQILLKSPCKKDLIDKAVKIASQYAYMPIINEDIHLFYEMGGENIEGFCGAELVFSSEKSPVITENTVYKLHRSGKLAWGNGIVFSKEKILSAGHDDDISITGHPEQGWGWLINNGFDIIQTDWVQALCNYIGRL